jgi:hypothetical protein
MTMQQRESMPTPNRAAKRALEVERPGSAPDDQTRGCPNTAETPQITRLQQELDHQLIKQCGLDRSIAMKKKEVKNLSDPPRKMNAAMNNRLHEMHGLEVSINTWNSSKVWKAKKT